MTPDAFKNLYRELKEKYKSPQGQWGLWCKRPKTEKEREEVVIGAILTQRTNWKNVELSIDNLKRAKLDSLKDICRTGKRSLAPLIKSSGFYRVKARYLFSLAEFIIENYGSLEKMRKEKLEKLRGNLLKIKGIGPETADSILLYALDKPVFVIDEYTRRLIKKRKLSQNLSYPSVAKAKRTSPSSLPSPLLRKGSVGGKVQRNKFLFSSRLRLDERMFFDYPSIAQGGKERMFFGYDFLQKLFEENLKKDFRLYQDLHALIVIDGKNKS